MIIELYRIDCVNVYVVRIGESLGCAVGRVAYCNFVCARGSGNIFAAVKLILRSGKRFAPAVFVNEGYVESRGDELVAREELGLPAAHLYACRVGSGEALRYRKICNTGGTNRIKVIISGFKVSHFATG